LLPTLLPGFVGTVLPGWLRDRLRAGLGGVCLFAQNISSSRQLRALTEGILAENPYAIIAIDEEGGDVTRLFAATGALSPGNAVLGRLDDLQITRDTAAMIGWSLRRLGCNVDFAPCVDINSRSNNPVIGVRSFGGGALLVSRHGRAWVAGLQSTGVAATAKHFPGHGDTAQDSHVSLPVVDGSLDALRRRELLPFVAAIQAGCRLIMTSHILLPQVDPAHPATMSRIVLQDLLRGELGFSGVIVSDALDMAGASGSLGIAGAAVAALRAGCDLLCLGTDNTDDQIAEIEQAVGTAVADGDLASARVSEAIDRVRRLASELEAARRLAGQPPRLSPGWSGNGGKLINTFDVQPDAWDWRARATDGYTVVRLEADANIAIGSTPWGPFTVPAFNPQPTYVITAEHSTLPPFQSGQPVLVVGRDIHRHRFAREAVDRLRSQDVDVLVVDMGWSSADRRYADVATFGASRLMGEVLLRWLARSS
jgi:beta-N-acetylhexosaminidase